MGREFWVIILATNTLDVFEVVSKQAVFMSENECGAVDLLGKVPGFEQMVGVFHSHVLTVSPCFSFSGDSCFLSRHRFVWLET